MIIHALKDRFPQVIGIYSLVFLQIYRLTSGVVAAQKEPDQPILATISTTHRPDSSTPMLTEVVQVNNCISTSFSSAESLKRLDRVNGHVLL